jgi:hypothetical protein
MLLTSLLYLASLLFLVSLLWLTSLLICRSLRICGFIRKIFGFAFCGLTHPRNVRICYSRMSTRICGFAIADLRFSDFKNSLLAHLSRKTAWVFRVQVLHGMHDLCDDDCLSTCTSHALQAASRLSRHCPLEQSVWDALSSFHHRTNNAYSAPSFS